MHECTRLKEKQKDSEAMAKSHNILWLKKMYMVGWGGGGNVPAAYKGKRKHIFVSVDSWYEIIQCKHMYEAQGEGACKGSQKDG